MFSGDLTINSVPTLEFASNLGDKVNIVNGNVFIEQNADMDPAVLQEVCDRLMTITGNINVRAQTSSAPAVQFPNLTGVTNVVIAQAGSISFPALLSSSKIVLGDNYSSRVDGVIDFSALTRVNSISTATVNVGWALASEALNTISFSKASNINFAALPYYSPRTLSIVGDQNTDLNLASLENKDANSNARDYTLNIDGAAELNVPGVLDGKITVTDVVNVILPEYVGEITVNSGVEILTMGKLSENLTATGNENDLITVDITSASAGVEINFTGATALTDAKIAGKLKTATFSGNADLTSLIISAELINLTINNTALAEASLDHTNGDYSAKIYLVATLDAGFTAKPVSASNKAAENQFVVNGSTTVSYVLTALANEFNNPSTISPYSVAVPATGAASQTATIISQDWSDAHTGKAVKFTQTSSSGATTHLGALQINTVVGSDDVLQGTDVQVTLTSKVPGETLSTIGNPPNGLSFTATVTAAAGVAGFSAVASGGSIAELGAYSTVTTLAGTTYTKSNFDSGSATNVGLNGTMGANLNRIPSL
ncbi:hypothetical protein N8873_00970 [Flavobacteriaceae bacterium]|nr:hypothetical protein [Flavobacteriaceae bacterium]